MEPVDEALIRLSGRTRLQEGFVPDEENDEARG